MEEASRRPETQEELDRFRDEWLSEVAQSKTQKGPARLRGSSQATTRPKEVAASSSTTATSDIRKDDYSEEVEPRAYHDLPDKESVMKLGRDGESLDRNLSKEPSSALEHYERAVEKETQGQLGDSIRHYRKAFKLDDDVQEEYKKKHFPPSSFVKSRPSNANPSNAAVTVPGTGHHSLQGGSNTFSPAFKQLLADLSEVRIEAAPPLTNISPQQPCFLTTLPEEILTQILATLAVTDVSSFARTAQVCKRLAYLLFTEESVWKRVSLGDEFGFAAMYYHFVCGIDGFPLEANDEIARYLGAYDEHDKDVEPSPLPEERAAAFSTLTEKLLHDTYASSWRQMFRSRPRIRFNGCYISTVNYTRAGATSTNTLSWGAPVHVVTYFRYLRFFRDGTVISLLTTSEPADVVHHLIKDNIHDHHGNSLASSVMKDALVGRWRLSGPISSVIDPLTNEPEVEGDVHVETEGVVSKYTYKMLLALAHAGKGTRNNKLAWKGFWSYNRLTDDWADFALKNDRAFYWSRVKSYGLGYYR